MHRSPPVGVYGTVYTILCLKRVFVVPLGAGEISSTSGVSPPHIHSMSLMRQ